MEIVLRNLRPVRSMFIFGWRWSVEGSGKLTPRSVVILASSSFLLLLLKRVTNWQILTHDQLKHMMVLSSWYATKFIIICVSLVTELTNFKSVSDFVLNTVKPELEAALLFNFTKFWAQNLLSKSWILLRLLFEGGFY